MIPLSPWHSRRQHTLRRLRRVARQHLRSQLIARQGWLKTITQALAWPLISTVKAGLALKGHPGALPSKLRQFIAYCWLQWAHNIRISDQQGFLLTLPHNRYHTTGYISCWESRALIDMSHTIRSEVPVIDDKRTFADFCAQHALPSPPILAESDGMGIQIHGPWPEADLFLKPSDLSMGQGAEILRFQNDTRKWLSQNGESLDRANFQHYAQRQLRNGPWILQHCLTNATAWSRFTAGGLATTRVITGRLEQGAVPCIIGCYLRLPRRGVIVDNLCSGGIGAVVDIHTGRLSKGGDYQNHYTEYSAHPDTGISIADEVLPEFQDIASLAIRAHTLAGNWATIGWDITLTESGPQLIEANLTWAIIPGIPIIDTPYIEIMQNAVDAFTSKAHRQT